MNSKLIRIVNNQNGATAVYVGLIGIFLLMLTSLAIDVGYLYGVRNELHNAADAGALAGAGSLFDQNGELTRNDAIDEAERVAKRNPAGNKLVLETTVETGHWSFTTQTFTPNDSTTQTNWQERNFTDLDADTDFINAVRVQARRSDTPSFFANVLGYDNFLVAAQGVAYIGFAGTLFPGELDQPIAICKESITDGSGAYSCNMGRMLNSGSNVDTSNTGGWTNFTQPCETANTQDMRSLICYAGNTEKVEFGNGMGATGGVQDTTFNSLFNCWEAATGKTTNWNMTLPVIECPGNNVSNCAKLVGAVNLNVIWMVHQNDPHYDDVPREMTVNNGSTWTCDSPDGFTCWKMFVDEYNLQNVDGPPVTDDDYETMYQKKNIFYLPDCTVHEPRGSSGGENFGVLARIPRIVQ